MSVTAGEQMIEFMRSPGHEWEGRFDTRTQICLKCGYEVDEYALQNGDVKVPDCETHRAQRLAAQQAHEAAVLAATHLSQKYAYDTYDTSTEGSTGPQLPAQAPESRQLGYQPAEVRGSST